jgi:hypothetical protein
MSADSLLARTSQYQISRAPGHSLPEGYRPYSHSAEHRHSSDFISRYANLRPLSYGHPSVDDTRPPSRRRNPIHYPNTVLTPEPPDLAPGLNSWNSFEDHASNLLNRHSTHNSPSALPSNPSEFSVTATCDDPSDDDEEATSPAILLDRQRRRHLGNEWPSSEDEDTDSSTRRYRRLRSCPREIKPIPTPQEGDELPSNTLEPHARFFIERKRNVVSLKFDPPV